jgi:hypothetical protein
VDKGVCLLLNFAILVKGVVLLSRLDPQKFRERPRIPQVYQINAPHVKAIKYFNSVSQPRARTRIRVCTREMSMTHHQTTFKKDLTK